MSEESIFEIGARIILLRHPDVQKYYQEEQNTTRKKMDPLEGYSRDFSDTEDQEDQVSEEESMEEDCCPLWSGDRLGKRKRTQGDGGADRWSCKSA